MTRQMHENLIKGLHPYLFVLQAGKTISKNYLDYSLRMLQVHNQEVLKAPSKKQIEL